MVLYSVDGTFFLLTIRWNRDGPKYCSTLAKITMLAAVFFYRAYVYYSFIELLCYRFS